MAYITWYRSMFPSACTNNTHVKPGLRSTERGQGSSLARQLGRHHRRQLSRNTSNTSTRGKQTLPRAWVWCQTAPVPTLIARGRRSCMSRKVLGRATDRVGLEYRVAGVCCCCCCADRYIPSSNSDAQLDGQYLLVPNRGTRGSTLPFQTSQHTLSPSSQHPPMMRINFRTTNRWQTPILLIVIFDSPIPFSRVILF